MAARIVFAIILCFAVRVQARPYIPGKFGPEFTFTRNGTVPEQIYRDFIQHLRRHLIWTQPEGAKFREKVDGNYHTFLSPNGWWFKVTIDNGVIEIKMSPLTVAESKRFAADIQDAIFVSAANVGLFPWDYLGGGHINMGIEIFGGDIQLARNFIVDYWNHNELSMGVMSYDTYNALAKELFDRDTQDNLHATIAQADAGEFDGHEGGFDLFLRDLNKYQREATDKFGRANRGKVTDLNLGHVGRFEVRAVRPQVDFYTWIHQIELLDSRINNHLRHIHHPLPFKLKVPVTYPLITGQFEEGSHRFVPPVEPRRALAAFYRYVVESGLRWQDHRNYLWPPWIAAGELTKFEQSATFRHLEHEFGKKRRRKLCELNLRSSS